jgi:3-oxoacyl-[acyl-carrier protein] reductase
MMKINLSSQNALVGGSTAGIGKAIALQLAACGASVTLMARNEARLKKVLQLLDTTQEQQHRYLVADFNDLKKFTTIITEYLNSHPVTILVNNTQGPPSGTVQEKSATDYQQAFDLLFQVVTTTTLAAIPAMKQKQYGRIINVASVSVKEPLPYLALSNSMRSAMASWAKTLATEVASYGITVNNLLTGYFDTERLSSLLHNQAAASGTDFETLKRQKEQQVPAQRFGKPEEYGYLAAFLASDKASYITGVNIPIDGGLLKSAW